MVIILALTFIEKENSSQYADDNKYTISYGVNSIPQNLKILNNLSARESDIVCALSKGLVSKDENNKIIPVLCSEINISEDKIQYEFKIRQDVYWSDKTQITSEDVVTFFKELLKEEDESDIAALLNVYGAEDFIKGNVTFMQGVAIKCEDDMVIIRLNAPDDKFLDELTKPQYRLRRNLVMWENMYKNYNSLVYSGDYIIEQIDSEKLVIKAIDNKKDKSSKIEFLKDENNELSMAAFEIRERDMVLNPPESEVVKFSKENKIATIPVKQASYIYINNKDNEVSLESRRNIYNKIYTALKEQCTDDTRQYELSECCYFREEKSNLTAIQARKVNMNNISSNWKEPEILTIISTDTEENRSLCKKLSKWFSEKTKITLKCSYAKENEFNDETLKNRYDMVLLNAESDDYNKQKLYLSFKEYLSESQLKLLDSLKDDWWLLEENLFNNYDILPLVFYNENVIYGEDISTLNIDSNGNIDFSSIT